MKRVKKGKFAVILAIALGLFLVIQTPAYADKIFNWSGSAILGEAGAEYPNFFPSGSAAFNIAGSTLTLTLTYTGASETIVSLNQTLTAFLWDITDGGVSLEPLSAYVASGSSLVNWKVSPPGGYNLNDLSGQWAFRSDINAGAIGPQPLGSYGVGTMGDINFGIDTFGSKDIINASKTYQEPVPDGADFALVGPYVDFNADGFDRQGPMVQNSLVFTFNIISGSLTEGGITNGQPLFGTDGAPLPEPSTILLLGSGLVALGLWGIKRKRRG